MLGGWEVLGTATGELPLCLLAALSQQTNPASASQAANTAAAALPRAHSSAAFFF